MLCYNSRREFAIPISGVVHGAETLNRGCARVVAGKPARSADLNKYLPNDASAYIHINVKQLFTAPLVRKAVPLAFDKYGDQILPLVQMAKAFNPNTPDIPKAQVKKGIEELKKEETIAKGFDVAKDMVTDIVISGDANDDEGKSFVILIKAPEQVTSDAARTDGQDDSAGPDQN